MKKYKLFSLGHGQYEVRHRLFGFLWYVKTIDEKTQKPIVGTSLDCSLKVEELVQKGRNK